MGTVTVVAEVTVPPVPVAVKVYCVVVVGLTVVEPEGDTTPIPWSMETVVAFAVVHVRVDEFPAVIVVGFAVSLAVGTDACTVTVAEAVVLPPGPVAVRVYCVVVVGLTVVEPEAATAPIP